MAIFSRLTLCSVCFLVAACHHAGQVTVQADAPPAPAAQPVVEAPPVATVSPEQIAAESARLDAFFSRSFDADLARHPMMQSSLGIKTDYDKWDDLSDAAYARELAITRSELEEITRDFDVTRLSEQAQLSHRLFVYNAQRSLAGEKWHHHSYAITHMDGIHTDVPSFLINVHRVSDLADAKAYIARLRQVDRLFAQTIETLQTRATLGIIPPAFVFPMVLEQVDNVIKGAPFDKNRNDSTLLADFRSKVEKIDGLDAATRKALIDQAKSALTEVVGPAYRELRRVLTEQAKLATNEDGAWKFPNGHEFYDYALSRTTTTNMTGKEIHELGLAEVARIHGEMQQIMATVGFKGDLAAFFEFMRTDKRFYEPNTAQGRKNYLDRATLVIDTMRGKLDGLFLTKPKAPIVVKAVEPFREKSAGKAFYESGTPDGSRPGTFYANLYDMKDMPTYQLEALAYHEGIPGHHMQISIAQELESIPKFRRYSGYTAYAEGWGLYSEYLAKEHGAYADPYSDFGRLAMELLRACRLVVDTGIHQLHWSREKAYAYLRQNTPSAQREAQTAIDRYIVWPSQATAYKIGMNHILALRHRAQTQLGASFDIREFHDVVLASGSLPLDILSERVEAWIASKAKPSGAGVSVSYE